MNNHGTQIGGVTVDKAKKKIEIEAPSIQPQVSLRPEVTGEEKKISVEGEEEKKPNKKKKGK